MTVANYNAQKVLYNLTLQHTIASTLDGVIPERVTNIVVAAAAVTRQSGKLRALAGPVTEADAVSLKYTVTVRDPLMHLSTLKEQLETAVASKAMDENLRTTATEFGVLNLVNGTFSAPLVTNPNASSDDSNKLSTGAIAGIIIGGILVLALIILACHYCMARGRNKQHRKVHNGTTIEVVQTP